MIKRTVMLYNLIFIFTLCFCKINASTSIEINNTREYEILDHFFRMGLSEEEYGYVLEGNKPISVRNVYSIFCFPITKDLQYAEKEFTNILFFQEALPIWKRLCSFQEKFILKTAPLNLFGTVDAGMEVQFINMQKLYEVIKENIVLFRYIIGPTIEPKQLVNRIAYSEETLFDILLHNPVLIGIVLGFGPQNSLIGGRKDTIQSLSLSKDLPPFASKSLPMHDQKEYYGWYYFDVAGGDDTFMGFRHDYNHLNPSPGFCDIKEELLTFDHAQELLPPCLMEKPAFIFGAYKGDLSNRPLFDHLQQTQKRIQKILKKKFCLEYVLEKISGKKPYIKCKKPASQMNLPLSFFNQNLNIQSWQHIVRKILNRFENQDQREAFIKSLSGSSVDAAIPDLCGVSSATLNGLRKALTNLSFATMYFEKISKDDSFHEIAPETLYFKTISNGFGKELRQADRVRLCYSITDARETILFAHHDTWLNLSNTVPGFAHGVQGMCIGEKRKIFIHPSLAYGILTTLPPCTELIVTVQLLDMDETSSKPLPSLTPLDLTWIQNPSVYRMIEESIQKQPHFIGFFYRTLINKMELSIEPIIADPTITHH